MTATFHYRMNNDAHYVLHEGEEAIREPMNEVAIAFDKRDGILHKHGDPQRVQAWVVDAQRKFRSIGFDDMANDLCIIQGRFPLDELNQCLAASSYIVKLNQKLLAGELDSVPRFDEAPAEVGRVRERPR